MEIIEIYANVLGELTSRVEDRLNGMGSVMELDISTQKARKLLDGRVIPSTVVNTPNDDYSHIISKYKTVYRCKDCSKTYDSFEGALNCCILKG